MTYSLHRRDLLIAGLAAGAATLLPRIAHAANSFPCDWKSGFVMDPNKKGRVGYLTSFNGLGLAAALATDLTVYAPYSAAKPPAYAAAVPANGKLNVVGVVENVSWGGGVGDPWSFSVYMSRENALLLKSLKQMTLKTTAIRSLGFWIANYDTATKVWYEQAYPKAPSNLVAQLNATSKTDVKLHVADEGVKVASGIDVLVYNVYFEIVPAANQLATFQIATSPTATSVKSWGLVVGTLPGAVPPR
jgi:hypothetical protein